jgi:hypothetical protein
MTQQGSFSACDLNVVASFRGGSTRAGNKRDLHGRL